MAEAAPLEDALDTARGLYLNDPGALAHQPPQDFRRCPRVTRRVTGQTCVSAGQSTGSWPQQVTQLRNSGLGLDTG